MPDQNNEKLALLKETLQENVGMSKYEADVYLALVRGGAQTMSELAKVSGVPKQRVYDTVEDLRDNEFVEIIDDYPRKAYAVDPTEALSDVQNQLKRAEEYLEEFHEVVETVESGIALFKSKRTIEKYVENLLTSAKHDILLLCPVSKLSLVADPLELCEDQQVRVIVSDPSPESTNDVDPDGVLPETVGAVRETTSAEHFALITDRNRGLYWSTASMEQSKDEEQGFYITNSQLALILDRFVSESVWPLSRPLRSRVPSLPQQYLRIRDCLSDLSQIAHERPLDSIRVEFEGYDTDSDEEVHEFGSLTSFYFTDYDRRASLTVDLGEADDGVQSPLVTVGGVGNRLEDYSAHIITISEINESTDDILDDETREYLRACQRELPHEFGTRSVVSGFAAYVDRMREIIEEWSNGYQSVGQSEAFKEALFRFDASERVPRIEWTQTRTEPGGHVAHTGHTFDNLGYDITLIGPLGTPIHSEFSREFRDQTLVSVGETTNTDYLRFKDQKLLFTEPNLDRISWETLLEEVELTELAEYVDGTSLMTVGTEFSTPTLPSLFRGLREDLWPTLSSPPDNVQVATDAIDRFGASQVRNGYAELGELDEIVTVTVNANRSQTRRFRDIYDGDPGTHSKSTVQRVRESLGVTRYIMHTNQGGTLATENNVLHAQAPQVVKPRQVRNVDAHFISGVAIGLTENVSDGALLILGNSVGRYFMRHKEAPNSEELRSFISQYDTFFKS
ncbi:TrmB family transcriptional regulator [Halococcus salsus]|uniref:TrmB family transcriptional regulator n=1 Tax=Halococcus salsus TaxID=2162894 RepID=UPI001358075F|nr:TrmB family transcriptional regulator sugar-binding domain-containing protein [Halococcus salsus]